MSALPLLAATKGHVITFGNWQLVKADRDGEMDAVVLRVRALLVDGKMKAYSVGQPHDVTERVFVVATAFRLNDSLPGEKQSRWIWQPGGWIQVDRSSGHITPLKLPNFDPQLSLVSWYRDYTAYCGVSEDNTKLYAIVMRLGGRKPILRKELGETTKPASAEPPCSPAGWQRNPVRVTFRLSEGPNLTFTIQGRTLEMTAPEEDDAE
jgi:hypothetical protein